jgi:transposase
MVVVGADVHKRSHTFVAVDEAGRQLGQLTVRADCKGHDKAIRWAQRGWGVEDCGGRWRTAVTCPHGLRSTCSMPPRWWCGCRRR